ncbi:hypothetical protein NMG60_11003593, partial [Bertholletia excelsa]
MRDDVKCEVEKDEMNLHVIKFEVDQWLKEVDGIMEDAESIAKAVAEAENWCLKGWCPNVKSRHSMGRKAEKMSKVLANLQAQRSNFNELTHPPLPVGMVSSSERDSGSPSLNAQISIFNPNSGSIDFESRSLTMTKIMDALKDDQVGMVGLCGMPGIGKTIMVKQVERATKVKKLFDGIAMITVGQHPDLIKIQAVIAEYLGLKLPEQVSLDARAVRVRERLRQINKVLIILDDVWNRLDLEKVGIPMGTNHNGCKVILTSRNEDVCLKMRIKKIIKIQELETHEAWALFKEMAGCLIDNPDFQDTARKIVKKCQGLPLALVTIGRALEGKDKYEWSNALRQLTMPCQATLTGVHEEVYPSLLLSYNHIANEEAKLLFNLCCLFPEDFEIPIEELFRHGKGKQLFEVRDQLNVVRDYAFSLVKDLKRRNLLLEGKNESHVKMHDVVREFGISITSDQTKKDVFKDLSLISHDDNLKQWPDKETFENYTCISLVTDAMAKLPEGLNCSDLELLMLFHNNCTISLPKNFFERMGALKILMLRNMPTVTQAPSLGLLKNLRTLCIQACGRIEIISAISELIKLEILSFRDSGLHEIPKEIGQLINLKLLDLTGCRFLEQISPGVISSLVKLEELYMRSFYHWEVEGKVEERQNASLNELEHLSNLNTLEILVPNPATLPRNPIFSTLVKYYIVVGEKKGFYDDSLVLERKLVLKQFNKIESSSSGINVLFKNTESLTLYHLKSEDIVGEAIQDGFHNLKYLTIWKCETTKFLEISSDCERLEEIFSKESEREVNEHKKIKFPSLEKLVLRHLPKFISFYKGIKEVEFLKLDTLEVYELPNIQSLFSDVAVYALFPNMANFHCLLTLYIRRMKTLAEIWDSKHQAGSCIKLNELHVYDCPKLENIITSNALTRLHKLQSLHVEHCYSLEEIVTVWFPNLSILQLEQLDSIEEIWCGQLLRDSFHKLTSIWVIYCNKLRNVGPSSMATSTSRLQEVVVRGCSQMEELFGDEENAEQGKTLFPQLRLLILVNMLDLKRFCHMSHDWELPSLCEVNMSKCPTMKTFSPTFVHTPNLTHILIMGIYEKSERVWKNNINDTLQYISEE